MGCSYAHFGVCHVLSRLAKMHKAPLVLLLLLAVVLSLAKYTDDHDNFKMFVRSYETLAISPTILERSVNHVNARVTFNAHGRNFSLFLKTHKNLFAPNFRLQVHEGNGRVLTHPIDTRHYVTGYLDGEGSVVHGKVSDERFEGIIHTLNESYHIERVEKHFDSGSVPKDHNVIVYRASDVDYERISEMSCGVGGASYSRLQDMGGFFQQRKYSGNLRRKRLADSDFNTCDIHVWADYEFFRNVGDEDEAQTLDEMAIHIMDADDIYRTTEFSGGLSGYGVAITSADILKTNNARDNPLVGTFTVEELLEAFSSFDFDNVCLGHLFTYRDFQGTLGLAYVADPDGAFAGGICDKRTQTFNGELNLNTGLTSLITFGRKLPQAVSTITTTHEIGHNFGSEHDPASCSPGGSDGNYIMYPTATDGNLVNNRRFSSCSTNQMGRTISSKGGCFIPKPLQQECGNGIVEGDEECDCKYNNTVDCHAIDPCCLPGECKLKEGATCSPNKYRCCNQSCDVYSNETVCATSFDECLEDAYCDGNNASCPTPEKRNVTYCNDGNNVCEDGICSGSVCSQHDAELCFCTDQKQLCDVCCVFDGICQSTFSKPGVRNASIASGFPCKDFTGYCDKSGTCVFIDTNTALNNLRNIIPSFKSIVDWLKNNWYWVLVGVAVTVILIILLQVTYRRKNLKKNKKTRRSRETGECNERESLTRPTGETATRL